MPPASADPMESGEDHRQEGLDGGNIPNTVPTQLEKPDKVEFLPGDGDPSAEEEPQGECRICLNDDDVNQLVKPCMCTGSGKPSIFTCPKKNSTGTHFTYPSPLTAKEK